MINYSINHNLQEKFALLEIDPTDNYTIIKEAYLTKLKEAKNDQRLLEKVDQAYDEIKKYLQNKETNSIVNSYTKEEFSLYLKNILVKAVSKKDNQISLYEVYNNMQNIFLTEKALKENLIFQLDLYLKSIYSNVVYQNFIYDAENEEIALIFSEDGQEKEYFFKLENDTIIYKAQDNITTSFLTRLLEVISSYLKQYLIFAKKYAKENLIHNRSIRLPYFMLNISSDNLYLQFVNNFECRFDLAITYFLSGDFNLKTTDLSIKKILQNKEIDLLKVLFINRKELPTWLTEEVLFSFKSYDINDLASEFAKRLSKPDNNDPDLISVQKLLAIYFKKTQEDFILEENLKNAINPFLSSFDRVKKIDYLYDKGKLLITTRQERQIIYEVLEYNKIVVSNDNDNLPLASKILGNLHDLILNYLQFISLNREYFQSTYHMHILNSFFDLKITAQEFILTLREDITYHNSDNSFVQVKYNLFKELTIVSNNKEVKNYLTKNLISLLSKMYIPRYEIPWWAKKINNMKYN